MSLKTATEYKANLFSILLENTIYFLITITFGYVLFENVVSISEFGFKEFLLLAFLINVQNDIIGLFWYGSVSSLDTLIKTGNFNSYFSKPMNPFFGFLFMKRFNSIIFTLYDLILFIPLLMYYFNFQILDVILAMLIFIFFLVFGIIFVQFLISFCWIFLEARKIFLNQLYFNGVQHNVGRFPMLFFEKNPLILLPLSGFAFYYMSMWITPLLTTGSFEIQIYEIVILLSVSVVSILGIIINWRIGLKKYEAFS